VLSCCNASERATSLFDRMCEVGLPDGCVGESHGQALSS